MRETSYSYREGEKRQTSSAGKHLMNLLSDTSLSLPPKPSPPSVCLTLPGNNNTLRA